MNQKREEIKSENFSKELENIFLKINELGATSEPEGALKEVLPLLLPPLVQPPRKQQAPGCSSECLTASCLTMAWDGCYRQKQHWVPILCVCYFLSLLTSPQFHSLP